jgi:GT2 family glycosyltransferase
MTLWKNLFNYLGIIFTSENCIDVPCSTRSVSSFAGCCFLANNQFVYEYGLFDEETFLYGEEHILAKKIELAGYRIYCEPRAVAIHKGNQSGKLLSTAKNWIEAVRSEMHYCRVYLNMNFYKLLIIKATRTSIFLLKSLVNKDYRSHFYYFIKEYTLR